MNWAKRLKTGPSDGIFSNRKNYFSAKPLILWGFS
nr:MAG TPA: hypothetical protein [Caudoviricetes sp.]